MDDTSGDSTLKSDFSHLNADMLHTVLELVSDGIWDWNANTGFVYPTQAGTKCSATPATLWTTTYSPGKT